MAMLENLGIPTTYSPSNVAIAVGQQLRSVSDQRLEELLSHRRGLILDACSAEIIIERGMGDLVGALAVSRPTCIDDLGAFSAEEFFNPSFGGSDGAFLTLTLPALGGRPFVGVFQIMKTRRSSVEWLIRIDSDLMSARMLLRIVWAVGFSPMLLTLPAPMASLFIILCELSSFTKPSNGSREGKCPS